jgi:hypothetical protein
MLEKFQLTVGGLQGMVGNERFNEFAVVGDIVIYAKIDFLGMGYNKFEIHEEKMY